MKMVMTIVPKKFAEETLNAIIEAGFTATFYETRGGMLRQSQTTMFSAVREKDLVKLLRAIAPIGAEENILHRGFGLERQMVFYNGTVVFIWSLEDFPDLSESEPEAEE